MVGAVAVRPADGGPGVDPDRDRVADLDLVANHPSRDEHDGYQPGERRPDHDVAHPTASHDRGEDSEKRQQQQAVAARQCGQADRNAHDEPGPKTGRRLRTQAEQHCDAHQKQKRPLAHHGSVGQDEHRIARRENPGCRADPPAEKSTTDERDGDRAHRADHREGVSRVRVCRDAREPKCGEEDRQTRGKQRGSRLARIVRRHVTVIGHERTGQAEIRLRIEPEVGGLPSPPHVPAAQCRRETADAHHNERPANPSHCRTQSAHNSRCHMTFSRRRAHPHSMPARSSTAGTLGTLVVETMGFEPTTPCLQSRCSAN